MAAEIVGINRDLRCAITNDGRLVCVAGFIDHLGEDTDTPAEAVVAIVRVADDEWHAVELSLFESGGVH